MATVYDIGGVKVRGDTYQQAASLADEIASEKGTTLSSKSLTSSPYFKLEPPKPSTEATGLAGYLEAQQTSYANDLQAKANEASQARQSSLDAFLKSTLQSEGETELQNKTYAETVDPLEGELKDINQQILAEQHSLRRRIEALQKNPNGLFGGALNDEIDRVTTESISKQADLSIIQMARQGKYDSAKAIADRAIAARLEKQKRLNEALLFNYQENKDLFNTAEQRAFETQQADRERRLQNEEFRLRAEYDQKIRQNDPLYQAQLAKAQADAAQAQQDLAGGGSNTDVLAYTQALQSGTATLAQVPQKYRGEVLRAVQESGTNKLLGLLDQYKTTISGLNFFTANLPSNKAIIDTLKGQITAVYKQQQQLGTLDNGVQTLVDKIIPDPSKPSISSLSNAAQVAAIDNFIANQQALKSSVENFGQPDAPADDLRKKYNY